MPDPVAVRSALQALQQQTNRPWTLMEVCGGQTHTILRWGLDQLLPPGLKLIHGPGCPVCVTPASTIDQALQLAARSEVILCSFGDMLRVPGSRSDGGVSDLLQARAAGADVRLITAPLQTLDLAARHPDKQVVLLAAGFETTAPATALLLEQARRLAVDNLSLLPAHVRVVPAMERLSADPHNQIQGFLAAGHVAAVMGTAELEALVQRHRLPVVVCGFDPLELLLALLACVQLLEAGAPRLVNAYGAVVRSQGNPAARLLVQQVFAAADGPWRGLSPISQGVLQLRHPYRRFDARLRFDLPLPLTAEELGPCRSAAVLQGHCKPPDCPSFATACTPLHPLGAPMVSHEGACAAYYAYRR